MIDLEQWLGRHAGRPLMWAVGGVLAMQVGYLTFLARNEYGEQLRSVERLVETASLGIQRDDRPLIEATLMRGLKDAGATADALCRGAFAEIHYPPMAGDLCAGHVGGLLRWTVRRHAVGIGDEDFVFVFDRLHVFGPFLVLGAITGLLGIVVATILVRARGRFEEEVLRPLCRGLNEQGGLAIRELEELRLRNEDYHALKRTKAVSEARFELSEQVAHDIRAPLATLSYAIEDSARLPGGGREVIGAAVARIQDIANGLLERAREGAQPAAAPDRLELQHLPTLVSRVVAEKRIQWKARPGVEVEAPMDGVCRGHFAQAETTQLERLLSNLLDNAVEAVGERGEVTVKTSLAEGMVELSVEDTGRGIPAEVLPRLGRKGATFGKAGGSGLGLYHAKTCVEAWGGSLQVDSKVGEGTTVRLKLPAAAAPASVHSTPARPDGILVDDDELMREVWGQAAEAHGKTLKAFASSEDFMAVADGFDRASPVYLDSRLGKARRGEAVARELQERGFTNISLVTGRPADAYGEMPWVRAIRGKSPPWV